MKIIMLNGPPGAGKTTYVSTVRKDGDCQVDMDLIPTNLPQSERRDIRKALLLRSEASQSSSTCWFSTAAPTRQNRDYWRSFVAIEQTIIFVPPLLTSLERQKQRDGPFSQLSRGVLRWYRVFEPPTEDEPNTLLISPAPV